VDFRFGGNVSGRSYTGPNWFGKDILANTGANFTIQAGSGRPYSRRNINNDYLIGSINGSRMPWSKTINVRFDRDFLVKLKGKDEVNNKKFYLNVYLDIFNILNTANVRGVSAYTGNPDDDGFLTAAKYQEAIAQQHDEAAYRNYYAMYNYNYPWNYSRPRTIQLGAIVSF
ncbi:MAG: TonB-dependent receptor, partial [Bacteroidetes bacterium]|nr:TonB-dependent receptor [Bacteroidota bacterium]